MAVTFLIHHSFEFTRVKLTLTWNWKLPRRCFEQSFQTTKISLITWVFDSESVSNANIVPYEVLLSFCSLQFDFPDSRVSQPSQNCQRSQSEDRTIICTNKNTSIKAQLTAFFHFGPAYGRRKLFDPNWNFSDCLTRNSTYSIHEILPRSISRWCGVTW